MTEKLGNWFSQWFGNQSAQPPESEIVEIGIVSAEIPGKEVITVCYCFNVDEASIKSAIKKHKLCSIEAVGLCLEAGTHCGSCHSRIQELLD
jgi:assimilatory nitrate reductase catalytic subunit